MRSAGIRKFLGELFTVVTIKADGDCFYQSIAQAFSHTKTVAGLREIVASAAVEDTLDLLRAINLAHISGYEWISKCDSLDALRNMLRLCSGQDKTRPCIWADDFAVLSVANALQLLILIFDEKCTDNCSKFVKILPGDNIVTFETNVVMLQRTRREHYNLLLYDSTSLLTVGVLPSTVLTQWQIHAVEFATNNNTSKSVITTDNAHLPSSASLQANSQNTKSAGDISCSACMPINVAIECNKSKKRWRHSEGSSPSTGIDNTTSKKVAHSKGDVNNVDVDVIPQT